MAIEKENFGIAKLLVDRGSNVNAVGYHVIYSLYPVIYSFYTYGGLGAHSITFMHWMDEDCNRHEETIDSAIT